jgi:hypothetical protein
MRWVSRQSSLPKLIVELNNWYLLYYWLSAVHNTCVWLTTTRHLFSSGMYIVCMAILLLASWGLNHQPRAGRIQSCVLNLACAMCRVHLVLACGTCHVLVWAFTRESWLWFLPDMDLTHCSEKVPPIRSRFILILDGIYVRKDMRSDCLAVCCVFSCVCWICTAFFQQCRVGNSGSCLWLIISVTRVADH